jgi:hypothetical protein
MRRETAHIDRINTTEVHVSLYQPCTDSSWFNPFILCQSRYCVASASAVSAARPRLRSSRYRGSCGSSENRLCSLSTRNPTGLLRSVGLAAGGQLVEIGPDYCWSNSHSEPRCSSSSPSAPFPFLIGLTQHRSAFRIFQLQPVGREAPASSILPGPRGRSTRKGTMCPGERLSDIPIFYRRLWPRGVESSHTGSHHSATG